jgi:hypothetical protein
VSGFLLGLCGLDGRRVRKNDSGTTHEVSFRVLAKAMIVDEERIIAKRSPLYSSQNTGNTAAASTIRMLLTGVDDSAIVQVEDAKMSAGRLAGRKEAIEGLLERDQAVLDELLQSMGITPELASELEAKLRELAALSSTALSDLRAAESKRGKLVNQQREHRGRLEELDGMLARASLLDAHYESDLASARGHRGGLLSPADVRRETVRLLWSRTRTSAAYGGARARVLAPRPLGQKRPRFSACVRNFASQRSRCPPSSSPWVQA